MSNKFEMAKGLGLFSLSSGNTQLGTESISNGTKVPNILNTKVFTSYGFLLSSCCVGAMNVKINFMMALSIPFRGPANSVCIVIVKR